jgi:hypothetical protein
MSRKYFGLISLAAFLLAAASGRADHLVPANTFTINGKSIACYDPRIIGKLTSIAKEGNRRNFVLYGTVRIVKGDCVYLDDGTRISIEQADADDYAICVRPVGDVTCWWITPGAIGR